VASRSVASLLAIVLGCGAGSGTTPQIEPGDADPGAAATPKCKTFDVDAALTTFEGGACPWLLSRDESLLELQSLDLDAPPPYEGELPAVCATRPCDWAGRTTSIGPLVLAMQRSPASEVAAGVSLGFVGADGRLAFVDLWEGAGDPVFDEGTELGPAHGLAPFDCAGKLGLFAAARTDAGTTVQPVPSLRAREGVYTDASTKRDVDRSRCTAIDWSMP
jgi:hypothetical protein